MDAIAAENTRLKAETDGSVARQQEQAQELAKAQGVNKGKQPAVNSH